MWTTPLLIAAAFALAACGEAQEPLGQFIANAGAQLRGRVPELPRMPSHEPVAYSAGELRDPFDPAVAAPAPAPRDPRQPDPLEAHGLEALRMVGTLHTNGERVALVRIPDGRLHQVRPGDHIGHNSGRVTHIRETEIILVEALADGGERIAKLELAR